MDQMVKAIWEGHERKRLRQQESHVDVLLDPSAYPFMLTARTDAQSFASSRTIPEPSKKCTDLRRDPSLLPKLRDANPHESEELV